MPPSQRGRVFLALILVQIFFGLHYLAAKVVLEDVPPRAWALIRVAAAAALVLLLVRALGRRLPRERSTWVGLAVCSLFGVALNQLLFVEGLSRTSATHSSLINTGIPIGTLFFAVLLRRERITLRKAVALGVGLVGVLLVIRPVGAQASSGMLRGDLLTLANAVSFAFFLVVSRRYVQRADPLAATGLLLAFGTSWMLVPGLPALATFDPSPVPPSTWALGAAIVLFPTVGAYWLTTWALARVESSVVALFIYLQPVIATSLSIAWLGEVLTREAVAGAALIFWAVYRILRPAPSRPGLQDQRQPVVADVRHDGGHET